MRIWGGIHMKTSLDAFAAQHGWRGVTVDKVLANVYRKVFNEVPKNLGIILESNI